jgi:SAM-dependent methyltransferase
VRTRLPLGKPCDLDDFRDGELRAAIRDVFAHEFDRFGPDYPDGVEYRKHWEVGMAALTLRRHGVLRRDRDVLGVGAGNEPTIFWLTNHVHRVFATDLYAASDEWDASANAAMLTDPGRYWPGPWDPQRLVAQHMDGRDLRYPDRTFDAVFSASSIEHFGDHDDVVTSLREIGRVLKPGGVATISTELRLAGPPHGGLPGILMFDADELHDLVRAAGLTWIEPLDTTIGDATLATALPFAEAAADVRAHVAEHGEILFHRLDWSRYPQLVLDEGDLRWTSVHLALTTP